MDRFSALAEPNRRRMIELIAVNGEMASTDISNKFDISASAVSQHLKVLREADLKHAHIASQVFKEYGALKIVDCWGDDIPDGKHTSFPMAVKKEADETVLFGWIMWPDKPTRDTAMQKAMEDPRMQDDENPMPFDGKRLIYGGFEMMYEA